MAIIKCKMCGGELVMATDSATGKCEYCGTVQTVPQAEDEKKLLLFERAERLRKQCEFDKAAGLYEAIVTDDRGESEAYWGLVLCKYGIEYVDDPATGKKIPTCHRSSFDNVLKDANFELAQENADVIARKVMREEAKAIEEIRRGIVAVSNNEEPYDIFICYKETGFDGKRTLDSVLAQDIYDALTEKGYRVFFSRITLEDKLGQEYEPYIFAALNSARIMLVVGTDYEHFNAVWVKNEWGRYLKLMAQDKEKHLIPCYKGIDAYDMPEEFARLQAQDLDKMGAIQDILRGTEKLLGKQETPVQFVRQGADAIVAPLMERVYLFLEDGKWSSADAYCEKVLDLDPKNADAYVGKLLAEIHLKKPELLKEAEEPFDGSENYRNAIRFGNDQLKNMLTGAVEGIKSRNQNDRVRAVYIRAKGLVAQAQTQEDFEKAANLFASIPEYKDAAKMAETCKADGESARKDGILKEARKAMEGNSILACQMAKRQLETIPGWKNAAALRDSCEQRAQFLRTLAEKQRIETEERDARERQQQEEKSKRSNWIALGVISGVCILLLLLILVSPA